MWDTQLKRKRVELRDVTFVLPRWEAEHATGGGQRGAELRNDYYGGGPPVEGFRLGEVDDQEV